MDSREKSALQTALKHIGSKDYLSDSEDYEIAPSPALIHTKVNNYFSEKILSKSSTSESDLKHEEEEKPKESLEDRLKRQFDHLHQAFKEDSINQTIESSGSMRLPWERSRIHCHSVETFNDRAYYESYRFNRLIKAVKSKVNLSIMCIFIPI